MPGFFFRDLWTELFFLPQEFLFSYFFQQFFFAKRRKCLVARKKRRQEKNHYINLFFS